MDTVFRTLEQLGLASSETREVYADRTRDREGLSVYRDALSGVVYIDGFYVGDEVYEEGEYRQQTVERAGLRDFELQEDVERRFSSYKQFLTGRTLTEFGCGEGEFLKKASGSALDVTGVELQDDFVQALRADGFKCFKSLQDIPPQSQDTVCAFHVLEHLPDPLSVLRDMSDVLKTHGIVILEVPHASDLLLSQLKSDAFKQFTLWSQHLILHTRESLRRLLQAGGFADVAIEGVQRYPLSNHLNWLSQGKPGGHKSVLSALDTPELKSAYEAALRKMDSTDTLVAVARKP